MKKSILFVSCCLGLSFVSGCNLQVQNYNITFFDDANNVLEMVSVKEGTMPVYSGGTPTKNATDSTHYTFNKWVPEIKIATEDAEYHASFTSELNTYTVTFDSDGGTPVASQTVEWGSTLKGVTKPTKEDTQSKTYTFQYWYDATGSESVSFDISTPIKRDYDLKAKWLEETKYYTLTFVTNGGSIVEPQRVNYNVYPTRPEDPTHDDSVSKTYTFDGWYTSNDFSGSEYTFDSYLTSDLTLFAKWKEEAKQCTVSFYSGTELFYSTKVSYGTCVSAPENNPTKAKDEVGEYTFNRWDFDFSTEITGDTVINAIYDINYIYYHYTPTTSTCQLNGTKEFWATKSDVFTLSLPEAYAEIIEQGQPNKEMVEAIKEKNPDDERLLPLRHEFDEITNECIYGCGTLSITAMAIDTANMTASDDYEIPYQYGQLYKYNTYAKNVFTDYSLEGLTKIKFYIVSPGSNNSFILHGEPSECEGMIFDGNGVVTKDGIIATRDGDDWTVVRESGEKMYNNSWTSSTSFTVTNPTKINELFDTFTYDSFMYFSDIIAEGTLKDQRAILDNPYFTGTSGNNTYQLADTGEKVTGHGKKYNYDCFDTYGNAAYFRELFKDIDISSFKAVEFYIDIGKGNYVTFANDEGKDDSGSEAYGLHALAGASTPGIIKAYNEGEGTWRVTASGFKFRATNTGAQVESFTYHNRTTLKGLFTIGSSLSWQNTTIILSDVIVTR